VLTLVAAVALAAVLAGREVDLGDDLGDDLEDGHGHVLHLVVDRRALLRRDAEELRAVRADHGRRVVVLAEVHDHPVEGGGVVAAVHRRRERSGSEAGGARRP